MSPNHKRITLTGCVPDKGMCPKTNPVTVALKAKFDEMTLNQLKRRNIVESIDASTCSTLNFHLWLERNMLERKAGEAL